MSTRCSYLYIGKNSSANQRLYITTYSVKSQTITYENPRRALNGAPGTFKESIWLSWLKTQIYNCSPEDIKESIWLSCGKMLKITAGTK